ncbi:polysaccharide pyruvyl transferase family protein [Eubacterium sp. MSJ-13]|uniref:polysaccharide pyruvyl transferase family protein n=1 Tax=Eubacterium sp. MSJ-13 TaxID=2841513 RepID=UPI001C11EF27|nr:polysaccharide pyruvyl transferase family protein [Eubacterium sp. MSJ-13]MBU5478969.1 polysaccharide pyruvyl transferase family protein [Eubacterium sp. MSJ-13]
MRIGTISLNINAPDFNYGAMLHSWAFQKYLKNLDYVEYTEIIDYTMPILEGQDLKYPFRQALLGKHLRSLIYYLKNYSIYKRRFNKFEKFIKANICKSQNKYTQATLNEAKLNYDCVICESDVIWSPGFSGGHFDKSFFLALDSMQNMKKIAYAPSMANGEMNDGKRKISMRIAYQQILCHN